MSSLFAVGSRDIICLYNEAIMTIVILHYDGWDHLLKKTIETEIKDVI